MSRYDDGMTEFLSRAKKSFMEGNPIIPGLTDLIEKREQARKFAVKFDRDFVGKLFLGA
jgi:hypothetical protein